ncbi:helix-turn-helix domain-containing protein [Mannheimia haemolytica]|nr:helix-turn-helix domain-containing protein [Mannheimia haemolytica]
MTTLGSRIKAYREQLGISQYEVAERCTSIDNRDKNNKWGQSRIANYERNNRTPDLDDIEILSKVLGVSPETLAFDTNVQLARPTKSNSYPLISNIQAGLWTEAFDFKDSEGYDYIDTEIDAGPDAFFLRISGMSMEPKFSEGEQLNFIG